MICKKALRHQSFSTRKKLDNCFSTLGLNASYAQDSSNAQDGKYNSFWLATQPMRGRSSSPCCWNCLSLPNFSSFQEIAKMTLSNGYTHQILTSWTWIRLTFFSLQDFILFGLSVGAPLICPTLYSYIYKKESLNTSNPHLLHPPHALIWFYHSRSKCATYVHPLSTGTCGGGVWLDAWTGEMTS